MIRKSVFICRILKCYNSKENIFSRTISELCYKLSKLLITLTSAKSVEIMQKKILNVKLLFKSIAL